MTESHLIILFLVILNIVQFLFFGISQQKLVNKIMSKNFAEYDLVKSGPPELKPLLKSQSDYEEELEEQMILEELNGVVARTKV